MTYDLIIQSFFLFRQSNLLSCLQVHYKTPDMTILLVNESDHSIGDLTADVLINLHLLLVCRLCFR